MTTHRVTLENIKSIFHFGLKHYNLHNRLKMPKFLNIQGLSKWIPKIIEETERELVIITPYMQLSDKIYNLLLDAEKKGLKQ